MKQHVSTESGSRGSPEGWLWAAYDALIHGGLDAVKIMPLAAGIKLARTSFYWHYKDREDLLAALADLWVERTTVPLIAATRAFSETEAEAMLNVIGAFMAEDGVDTAFEFAIRGWALRDDAMMRRLRAEDAKRLEALQALMRRWGHSDADAEVRGRTIYHVQIGYISMQSRETLAERMKRLPKYVGIYSGGRLPEPREIARFHARIGYQEDAA